MRLIDADQLLKKTHNYYPSIDHYCCSRKVVELRDIIEAPTIEAEPVKHGRWEHKKHKLFGNEYDYICSTCGCDYALAQYRYCPNCGCKMDLEV